jgi:signal transduction histidine kinase/CheY-like chemotaxis protein
LSFPGLFAPGGLMGAGPQSTAWIYMLWHGGFPLTVIAYALLMPRGGDLGETPGAARGDIIFAIAVVAAIVSALSTLVTAGHAQLPPIMRGNHYTPIMIGVVTSVWLLSLAALAVLWRRRPRSVLDVWLMVTMCAWMFDIGLSAVLNAGRFDLGFYAGRVYGLLAASFVLLVLLLETRALYAKLAHSLLAERELADARARDLARSEEHLRQVNESLEERVAERTSELRAEIAERERVQEALRETQKLEAIGRLAGSVAHDFNNLLTVIQGNTEFLLDSAQTEADLQAAQAIDRSVERGTRLVRQVLAFSRRQGVKPETINLHGRGDELADLLSRSLRGDIRLTVAIPASVWSIKCDAGELELALLNLCVNARDAMPNGGAVRVEARNFNAAIEAPFDDELDGEYVALSVTDSGTGIPPDVLARVFEPFFTTKEVGKGTGLGLSQVHGFAQQTGGRATIESEFGRGTTVTLYLPRAAAAVAAQPPPQKPTLARGSGMVLLVEDDDEVAAAAERMLAAIGYRTQRVRNAGAALALIVAGQRFDAMFSDIVMPGNLSGLDLARKVRQRRPSLPILLASGYGTAVADAAGSGFRLIAKPYGIFTLSGALREIGADARSRDSGSALGNSA